MKTTKYVASLILILLFSCSIKKSNIQQPKDKPEKTQQKDRIAVLDFKTVDLPMTKSRIISELIRTDLINKTNKFIIVERSQMDTILKEQGFQMAGCTDEACAVTIGKLITAQKILIGSVMKVGESIVVTSRIVDVERGVADSSARVTAENEESLVQEIGNLVAALTGGEAAEESGTSGLPKILVKAVKRTYNVGEDIVVTFKNFPVTRYDYISIAKEGEAARNHYTYQYTPRQTEGTVTFYRGVNAAGKYEIRAHTNYDKGDVQPTAVFKITVK